MLTNRLPPKVGDLIGRRIGGYMIDGLVGAGGMGSVYSATNARLGMKMAIKVIAREYTQDPELVGRFFREAKACAALEDPNIIDVYDCHEFAEDGLTYISMRYIEGHSLAALLKATGPMAIETAVVIAVQIASGLDAAHELGIVHRDIKPENVLIWSRWRRRFFATILDFGIAKLLDPVLASNYRTKASAVVGTLYYMAPEQARGDRDVDPRADIYSLGVVLYELLTGRRPYNEETVYGLVERQRTRAAYPRPRELRPEIPQVIDELLLDMLQVDRQKRPTSMAEVGQRLVQGVSNGDLMLRTLAGRLSLERSAAPMAPNELTLVGDIESSITRWTPARSMIPGRRRSIVPLALAMTAGTAIGGITMRFIGGAGDRTAATVAHADPSLAKNPTAPATPPDAHVAEVAPIATSPPGDPPAVATVDRVHASPLDGGLVAATMPADAQLVTVPVTDPTPPARHAPAVPAARVPVAPISKPASNSEPKITRTPSKPAEDAAGRTGVLVIRTHSWADVWVDGVRRATSPVRLDGIPVGRHVVLLKNDLHDETVTVSVTTKTEAVIEKSW